MDICILGLGSIGQRHLRNMHAVAALRGFAVATDGVEPMAFGGTSSAPKVTITINNPSDSAVYAVYASGTVDGTFARVTSKQTRKGDLLSLSLIHI